MLNKEDSEKVIRELFRDNIRLYPDDYPTRKDGRYNKQAFDFANEWAISMWENRTEGDEIDDTERGVTLKDYKQWVRWELEKLNEEDD